MEKEEFKFPNPGIGWTWIVDLILKALGAIVPILSPAIKKGLEDFLTELYKKAKETANPWDDFLLKFLMRILGIEFTE